VKVPDHLPLSKRWHLLSSHCSQLRRAQGNPLYCVLRARDSHALSGVGIAADRREHQPYSAPVRPCRTWFQSVIVHSRARIAILIGPTLGALFPSGGPIQDPVLTAPGCAGAVGQTREHARARPAGFDLRGDPKTFI